MDSSISISPPSSISLLSQTNVNGESNVVPPNPAGRHTAVCWNFFTFPENPGSNTKLKCLVCKKEFKFNPKTSSNLTMHCRDSHPKKYLVFGGKVQNAGLSQSQQKYSRDLSKECDLQPSGRIQHISEIFFIDV